MALYHKATVTPSKAELIAAWLPRQPWCPDPDADVEVIGAYRFDDPEGSVGMEAHLVMSGDTLVHVPLTYRDAPLASDESGLVGTTRHSALGDRWVYDGLQDETFIVMLAAAALTGQGEALGMVMNDGRWYIAPTNVRIQGGGWSLERVPVDGFESDDATTAAPTYRNDGFQLSTHRLPVVGQQPKLGLTASWDGGPGTVVLARMEQLFE